MRYYELLLTFLFAAAVRRQWKMSIIPFPHNMLHCELLFTVLQRVGLVIEFFYFTGYDRQKSVKSPVSNESFWVPFSKSCAVMIGQ